MAGRAQPVECDPCRTERLLSGVPERVDAVLVVAHGSGPLRSEPGAALLAMLGEAGVLPETARAWEGLARTLDWTPVQAFDELLGRKFTLLLSGLDRAGGPDWALVTEVSTEAERRLRLRLKAAPRGSLAGLAVLAVEDGRYELMVGRRADPAGQPATATVLLGPGGDNPLFTELASSLVSRTGVARPFAAWRVGDPARDCDAVFRVRRRDAGGLSETTIAAALDGGAWTLRVTAAGAPELRGVRPWSDRGFRALQPGAAVALMGVAGLNPTSLGLPFAAAPWPRALLNWGGDQAPGGLAAVFLRPAPTVSRISPEREPTRVYIGRAGVVQRADRPDEPLVAMLGDWSLTAAMESGQSAAMAAAAIASLQSGAMTHPAAGLSPHEQDSITGRFRTMPADELGPLHPGVGEWVRRIAGDEAVLSWGASSGGSVVAAGEALERADTTAWSVVSLSPGGRASAQRDAEWLASAGPGVVRRWVSLGQVRPAALASLLGGEQSLVPAWARRIDTVRWDSWVRDDGAIETNMSIRLVPGRAGL